ncbi:MAG: hypothetical protein P8107_08425 [Spirochaetia bacterium]
MTNIINYEDDIFYLTHIVKKLADGLKLEIDSQLKINRDTILKNMLRLNRHFIRLLDDIINQATPFTHYLQEKANRFSALKTRHAEFMQEIEDILSSIAKKGNGDQETISEEEMRILLTNHDDEE